LLLQVPNRGEREEQQKKKKKGKKPLSQDAKVSRLQKEFQLQITMVHIISPKRHQERKIGAGWGEIIA